MLENQVIVLSVHCTDYSTKHPRANWWFISIVVAAAGAAVLCGYATARFYIPSSEPETLEGMGGEFTQAQYQREVRLRNLEIIAERTGHGRNGLVCFQDPASQRMLTRRLSLVSEPTRASISHEESKSTPCTTNPFSEQENWKEILRGGLSTRNNRPERCTI